MVGNFRAKGDVDDFVGGATRGVQRMAVFGANKHEAALRKLCHPRSEPVAGNAARDEKHLVEIVPVREARLALVQRLAREMKKATRRHEVVDREMLQLHTSAR